MFGLKARIDLAVLFQVGFSSSVGEFCMLGVDLGANQDISHPESEAEQNYLIIQEDKIHFVMQM